MSINAKINLTSAKDFIGEFLLDFDIQNTNYISSLNRHITRGIELTEIDIYYRKCLKVINTEETRALIPCNSKLLEYVILDVNSCPYIFDLKNNGLNLINASEESNKTRLYGYVEGRYLNLNDYKGKVGLIYKSLPIDKEGYILFPDDSWLKEALLYFLIYKMSLSGFRHPVISRQEAEQKWNVMYPRARNSVNFPTVEDIRRYTENVTSPLFNNIDRQEYGNSNNIDPVTNIFSNSLSTFTIDSLVTEINRRIENDHIVFEDLEFLPNN